MKTTGEKVVTVTYIDGLISQNATFIIRVNTVPSTKEPSSTEPKNESESNNNQNNNQNSNQNSNQNQQNTPAQQSTESNNQNSSTTTTPENSTSSSTQNEGQNQSESSETVPPAPVQLHTIAVSASPKLTYNLNEEFSAEGLSLTITYSDQSTKIVSYPHANISLTTPDMSTAGEKTITVTYTEDSASKTTSLVIHVNEPVAEPVKLESINIIALPKTTYRKSQSISLEGLSISANYSDGTKQSVAYDENTASKFNYSSEYNTTTTVYGEYTITVYYTADGTSCTADFTIFVGPSITEIAITTLPKTDYKEGEEITLAGMVIQATYEDGTTKSIKYDDYPEKFSSYETQAFLSSNYIYYTDEDGVSASTMYTMTVKRRKAYSWTMPKKQIYAKGEEFDGTGLSVTYDDTESMQEFDYDKGAFVYKKIIVTYAEHPESFSIAGFDSTATGECTLKLSYDDSSKNFTIRIIESNSITLTVAADGSKLFTQSGTVYASSITNETGETKFQMPEDINNYSEVTLIAQNDTVDVGGFWRATQALYGQKINFDYQNDIANTKFNLKMSDVADMTSTPAFSNIPKTTILNENYDVVENLINGVSMRHHPRVKNRFFTTLQRAVEFSSNIKNVNVDFGTETTDLTSLYKGGFIVSNNTNVTLNVSGLNGEIYTDQLEDNRLFKELKTNSLYPTIDIKISHDGNDEIHSSLYGVGVEKLIDKYYNNNKKDIFNLEISSLLSFNAKSYLNGENMFDANGYKNNAYRLSANAAAIMLKGGVNLSNVAITGTNDTGITVLSGETANIYTTTDWSSINDLGNMYGMMYFGNKPPSKSSSTPLGDINNKIVFGENSYNPNTIYGSTGELDISALPKAIQDTIDLSAARGSVYFSSDATVRALPRHTNAYIYGTKYIGILEYTYTNESWENYGNTRNRSDLIPVNESDYTYVNFSSRLDNIKLSPIEKLLLDNQRTHG